jgi:hypothetical protein
MTDTGKATSKLGVQFLGPILLSISLNLVLMVLVDYELNEGNVSREIKAPLMGIISTSAAFNVGLILYAIKIGARRRPTQPAEYQ